MGDHVENGDGGLMQAALEAVDGSRLAGFFVEVVPSNPWTFKPFVLSNY